MDELLLAEDLDLARQIKKNRATELLTVSQVAKILNVHANTVRRWSEQGILKSFRVGPRADRRFYYSDVIGIMQTKTPDPSSPLSNGESAVKIVSNFMSS